MTPTESPGPWARVAVHVTETLKDHESRITTTERSCAKCGASKVDWDNHNALKAALAEMDKKYAVDIAKLKTETTIAKENAAKEARHRAFWISLIASVVTSIIVGVTVFAITKSIWS